MMLELLRFSNEQNKITSMLLCGPIDELHRSKKWVKYLRDENTHRIYFSDLTQDCQIHGLRY